MIKSKVGYVLVACVALISFAPAQTHKGAKSSVRAPQDPVNKPLSSKSPISTGKPSAAPTGASTSSRKTNAELAHLEKQGVVTGSKTPNSGSARTVPVKTTKTSSGTGSGINASYQKPHIAKK